MISPLRCLAVVAMGATVAGAQVSPAAPAPVPPASTPAVAPTIAPAAALAQAAARAARDSAALEALRNDWAGLRRYRGANDSLPSPAEGEQRVVFYGNSITDGWARHFPVMFPGKPYVGRGISGQTTPQMLVRFHQDVIALQPRVVVILAGTNDIAGNTGPSTLEMIEDNLSAMTELAKQHGIRVVLSSVLPVYDYPWKPGLEPAPKIIALNAWLKQYAESAGETYLDYHTAMADARGGLPSTLAADGVHPNEAGYRIMAALADAAIARALATP
ncbi:MAG: SGNH/GDSL hydrolase family protein [Gemmatimonadota bacterium]|nr:SGNH/GDSL hydrolase family protein [Gemmatimonadota bacterium]